MRGIARNELPVLACLFILPLIGATRPTDAGGAPAGAAATYARNNTIGREDTAMGPNQGELRLEEGLEERERPSFAPLDAVRFAGTAPVGSRLELWDGKGQRYATHPVEGAFSIGIPVGCSLGEQRAALVDADGTLLAEVSFSLDAETAVQCNTGGYSQVWDRLAAFIKGTGRTQEIEGKNVRLYVHWLRDDTHVMKAYKYWEPEPGQLQEHFLDIQTPEGIIYDYIMRKDAVRERAEVFEPRYSRLVEGGRFGYNRLPVEADVEYLAVEAVYTAWQARGDDRWMARQLPALQRGLNYMMTDPLRWSEEHGLVKRAYTIDTWDFKFFGFDRSMIKTGHEVQEYVFNIHPNTPMAIMHGDNSGMYQACRQMARMHAALGNEDTREEYDAKAEMFRDNTNKHCWNGRYYDHWVPVTPLDMDQGGVDGCKVLSLSNPYDINRGLPDHEQAVRIISEYRRLRDELKDTYFAEWFSVYPWWPKGFSGIEPAQYVNGGIIIIVAGELAKAAFHHGFEDYGADIIERVYGLMEKHRSAESAQSGRRGRRRSPLPCTYTPSGDVSYGIPDTWAQAAVVSAIMEGLCGLRDEATVFGHALVEPRWVAAGVTEAAATARYGASDGYVAYRFSHDPVARRIVISATGSGERFDFHVLLPAGARAREVAWEGRPVGFKQTAVQDSPYADFVLERPLCGTVEIHYDLGG